MIMMMMVMMMMLMVMMMMMMSLTSPHLARVRVWYYIFSMTNTMYAHQYTASVLAAGLMCIGNAFAFHLFLLWMVVMAVQYARVHSLTAGLRRLAGGAGGPSPGKRLPPADLARARMLLQMYDETFPNVFRQSAATGEHGLELCLEMGIDPMAPNVTSTTSRTDKVIARITVLFHC